MSAIAIQTYESERLRWVVVLSVLCATCSCHRDALLAPIPTFLAIEKIGFETSPGQGTAQQQFSEAWIYADTQLLGAYPVPAMIPVLGEGSITLQVFAGIRQNGQATMPVLYPMTAGSTIRIEVNPGHQIAIEPVVQYHPGVNIVLSEDFEQSNTFRTDLDGNGQTVLEIMSSGAIEGRSAIGLVTLTDPILEVANNFPFALPTNGRPVFVELQYYGEAPLAIGLYNPATRARQYKLVLFATDMTTKVYVDFTGEVRDARWSEYQIVLRADYNPSSSGTEQRVVVDNLKVLHF